MTEALQTEKWLLNSDFESKKWDLRNAMSRVPALQSSLQTWDLVGTFFLGGLKFWPFVPPMMCG